MRESTIEKYLVSELKKIGIQTRKVKWIGRDGAPDRVILANGGIWVELKAPGEVLRMNQIAEGKVLRAAGMWHMVVDSKEQVDELMRELGKCT